MASNGCKALKRRFMVHNSAGELDANCCKRWTICPCFLSKAFKEEMVTCQPDATAQVTAEGPRNNLCWALKAPHRPNADPIRDAGIPASDRMQHADQREVSPSVGLNLRLNVLITALQRHMNVKCRGVEWSRAGSTQNDICCCCFQRAVTRPEPQ